MDTIKTLEEIAQLMDKYGLSEISVENGDFKADMSKKPPEPPIPPMAFIPPIQPAVPAVQPAAENEAKPVCGNFVKSPIVGTFYAASAPGKAPYVTVGKTIKPGDVLFIIESMKLMNEVKSEVCGTVAEILVSDGESVEFDQPILRLE